MLSQRETHKTELSIYHKESMRNFILSFFFLTIASISGANAQNNCDDFILAVLDDTVTFTTGCDFATPDPDCIDACNNCKTLRLFNNSETCTLKTVKVLVKDVNGDPTCFGACATAMNLNEWEWYSIGTKCSRKVATKSTENAYPSEKPVLPGNSLYIRVCFANDASTIGVSFSGLGAGCDTGTGCSKTVTL